MNAPHLRSLSARPRVAVVGAGIVGTCIALELQKRGMAVSLIDKDEPGSGCSYGNSGAISESSIVPLATPGVLTSLPKMLLDRESPLRLPIGYLPAAAPWLARFALSARPDRMNQSVASLASLHHNAVARHAALTREVGVPELFMQKGHLHLYPDQQSAHSDAQAWQIRERHGFRFEVLDRDGITALEPRIGPRYQVGIYLADHATIRNPARYVTAIAQAFVRHGGRLLRDEVHALAPTESKWVVKGIETETAVNHVVVAAGAWSRKLLDPLQVRIPLESQRGYHVQFSEAEHLISRTVVLTDRKVFVTPMEGGLRVGGTVEIAGLKRPPDMRRAAVLERIARETFTDLGDTPATSWMGHRPCMPDSVPLVGAVSGQPGLWLAVGHGHLGLTDSVNTASRIADRMAPGYRTTE
jgi:D-amino-acid dehydrogenase